MNSGPSITILFSFPYSIIPHSLAIALAVNLLSPVTILTFIPANLQRETALGTSYLRISLIPRTATKVRSCNSTSNTPLLSLVTKSSFKLISL